MCPMYNFFRHSILRYYTVLTFFFCLLSLKRDILCEAVVAVIILNPKANMGRMVDSKYDKSLHP